MQELPGSQIEEAFYKSVTRGEALLSEVQGYEDNTELGGERSMQDGSPGWLLGGGGTVPGLLFLEALKGNTSEIN